MDDPSQPEMRVLRRIRSLQSGVYLCIIQIDSNGITSLSIIGNAKLEKVRKFTDIIEPENPAHELQEHS